MFDIDELLGIYLFPKTVYIKRKIYMFDIDELLENVLFR